MEEKQWQDMIHSYLACIAFVDAQVGRLLDALDASRYAENTLVILWSDHGYHMGEKNAFQKHTVWERSSRAPMIIAGPGVTAGQRCDRVVSLLDIYPTLVDLCAPRQSEVRRTKPAASGEGPSGSVALPGAHQLPGKPPRPANRIPSLHPLREWQRGTLRPRPRST